MGLTAAVKGTMYNKQLQAPCGLSQKMLVFHVVQYKR